MRINLGISAVLCLALGLVAACKSSSTPAAGGKVASCNTPAEWACTQYSAGTIDAAGEASLKSTCDGKKGTFALTECPTAKQISKCASPEGDKYEYDGTPAPSTEKDCKDARGGTFAKLGAK